MYYPEPSTKEAQVGSPRRAGFKYFLLIQLYKNQHLVEWGDPYHRLQEENEILNIE